MIYTYYFRTNGGASGGGFAGPWDSQGAGPEPPRQVPLPRDGTLRNLRVLCTDGAIANAPVAFFVRVNGVDTPITTTIAAGGTAGNDLANTAPALAVDLLSIRFLGEIVGGSGASMPNFVNISVDFETADP